MSNKKSSPIDKLSNLIDILYKIEECVKEARQGLYDFVGQQYIEEQPDEDDYVEQCQWIINKGKLCGKRCEKYTFAYEKGHYLCPVHLKIARSGVPLCNDFNDLSCVTQHGVLRNNQGNCEICNAPSIRKGKRVCK